MAKNDDNLYGESSLQEISGRASRLGPGLTVRSELTGSEDLVLQGAFKGLIGLTGANLYVDLKAQVEADVDAADVLVHGSLTGNIRATGRVLLAATSCVKGDITAARISIEDGAMFRGAIQMTAKGA